MYSIKMFHHLNEMGQLSNGFDWLCESLLSKFSMVQEKKAMAPSNFYDASHGQISNTKSRLDQ